MNYLRTAQSLILRTLAEDKMADLLDKGVGPSILPAGVRTEFRFLHRYYLKYGQLPSREIFFREYPNFPKIHPKEPYDYYFTSFQQDHILKSLSEHVQEADLILRNEDDKPEAIKKLMALFQKIKVEQRVMEDSSLIDLTSPDSVRQRLQNYLISEKRLDVGIPSGFRSLDDRTRGWHGGDFVVLVAERGQKKTWILLNMALVAHKNNFVPLIISKEMADFVLSRRLDALDSELNYDAFVQGKLTYKQRIKFLKGLQGWMEKTKPFYVARGVNQLEKIPDLIVKSKCNVLMMDAPYLYATSDKSGKSPLWERMTYMSSFIKQMALEYDIPILITTQFAKAKGKQKKSGEQDIDDLAYTNAFSQDADILAKFAARLKYSGDNLSIGSLLKFREGACDFSFGVDFNFDQMSIKEGEIFTESQDEYDESERVAPF